MEFESDFDYWPVRNEPTSPIPHLCLDHYEAIPCDCVKPMPVKRAKMCEKDLLCEEELDFSDEKQEEMSPELCSLMPPSRKRRSPEVSHEPEPKDAPVDVQENNENTLLGLLSNKHISFEEIIELSKLCMEE